MNSLGDIDDQVGSLVVRSETPDLGGIVLLPSELVRESLSSDFDILSGRNLVAFDKEGQFIVKWAACSVDSVVLILRFGHDWLNGIGSHCFLVGDDWIVLDDLALGEVFLEIVEADFNVELAAAGDDVFSAFVILAKDQGVRFGELLKALDQLGEVSGVLGLDCNSDDG